MSSMSSFLQFINATRQARLTPASELLNDASKRTYLFSEMIRARPERDYLRSGTHIEERIKLSNVNNFGAYVPGGIRTPTRRATMQVLKYPWRTYENNYPLLDTEIDLNSGGGDEFAVFKNLKDSIEQDLQTDHLDGLENLLFAVPTTDMESLTLQGGPMNSIPLFITEDGLAPIGLTTVCNLTVSTNANWQNQFKTYDSSQPDDPTSGIFAAFDYMAEQVKFEMPTTGQKYYENDDLRKMKIVTNLDGKTLYSQLCRLGNDQFRYAAQDPAYGSPAFAGIPVQRHDQLDTQLLDQVSGSSYTSQVYPTGKPRYFWINCKYIFPVFHSKHTMRDVDPINGGAQQRDVNTLYKESWAQLVCRSRRRQGIIRPA